MAPKVVNFNPAALAPILLNTGLQQSDPPLYQFLNQLIAALIQAKALIAASSSSGGGGGSVIVNEITKFVGIPGLDGADGGDQFFILPSSSSSGPASDVEWSVLTNGNSINPELVYAGGDVIMLHTP